MTTTSSNAAGVGSQYYDAVGRGDIAAARSLLWDDLSFKGPLDAFSNADDLMKALVQLAPVVKGIQPQKVLVDGDDVGTFYDMLTPMGAVPIAEWHHVRDGKID